MPVLQRANRFNWHRCLLAGGKYNLQVVFRLFQLWFTLGTDADVNAQIAEAFRDTPSHKMLVLVYQSASRMSAAKSGPYYDSGFQVKLLQQLTPSDLLGMHLGGYLSIMGSSFICITGSPLHGMSIQSCMGKACRIMLTLYR